MQMVSMMEKHLEQLTEMPKVMGWAQLTVMNLVQLTEKQKELHLVCSLAE